MPNGSITVLPVVIPWLSGLAKYCHVIPVLPVNIPKACPCNSHKYTMLPMAIQHPWPSSQLRGNIPVLVHHQDVEYQAWLPFQDFRH
ncbi:unnamed protein product [Lota lota]